MRGARPVRRGASVWSSGVRGVIPIAMMDPRTEVLALGASARLCLSVFCGEAGLLGWASATRQRIVPVNRLFQTTSVHRSTPSAFARSRWAVHLSGRSAGRVNIRHSQTGEIRWRGWGSAHGSDASPIRVQVVGRDQLIGGLLLLVNSSPFKRTRGYTDQS
ncbi:hypothetical protein AOLI_G00029090 [Acnodon oligacanthus]